MPQNTFFRIHHSYIININHIDKYIKANDGRVLMKNGVLIDMARRKKEEFIEEISKQIAVWQWKLYLFFGR